MNPNNPVTFFENLPPETKNLCFLHGEWETVIAYNPKDKFSGKNLADFQKFVTKNTKKNRKLIGYISYDIGYQLHKIKAAAKDDLKLPHIFFLAFDNWETFKPAKKIDFKKSSHTSTNFKPTITEAAYKRAYNKAKKHIQAGDIYQLNLTHRLEAETTLAPRELFLRILEANPVNYAAYIEGNNFEILSASPERFIKIEDGKIETCPIKGTRRRGKTKTEDQKLLKDLLNSEKEAAELNMITDLLRNDLGKISKIGSVNVQGHRLISECPTVWHTYSKITSELAPKISPTQALISMLPGGSITGCPKKRAMEIIDQLEPTTRSVYTGVIGQINSNQNLDFNIAIRTVIKKRHKLYLQVGGGIVHDSKEQAEYDETLQKAKSFMNILC